MKFVRRPASTRSPTISNSSPSAITTEPIIPPGPANDWRQALAFRRTQIMIKTSTGISALALAASATTAANAQLVTTKQLPLPMAVAIATTAVETCKSQGYNVSVHVIGNMGEV